MFNSINHCPQPAKFYAVTLLKMAEEKPQLQLMVCIAYINTKYDKQACLHVFLHYDAPKNAMQ
jgi:hypothetical protein